jgi:hypothetical protein
MEPQSHYALLVAINHYPGLSDLAGPENDAAALAAWLTSTGGLESAHVKIIRSSDYAKVKDPYDANPTDTHIKRALNTWLKDPEGNWLDRVGERLYLFFAGHGFTAGSLTDPALFTAQAQLDDRTHIAALRYAMKIVNAGFFDEIVLVMDCCQDVLKSSSVIEPSWSPPDRSATSRVKVMTAFGAPRGRKAFEDAPPEGMEPAAPVRGYFSKVFLEALENAPADQEGRVTARAVEDHFLKLWPPYQQRFEYVPPIDAPRDLVLYRRSPVAPPAAFEPPPSDTAEPPPPKPEQCDVTIELTDPAMQVSVINTKNRVVARAVQTAHLRLPPGHYRARFQLGRTLHETPFLLNADGSVLEGLNLTTGITPSGPGLPSQKLTFSSPVPAPWSTTCHEYHFNPCSDLLEKASRFEPENCYQQGVFFLFARDSAHHPERPWSMSAAQRSAIRLRRLGIYGVQEPMALDIVGSDVEGWRSFTSFVDSGTWLLGVKRRLREHWMWDDIVVEIAPGMRTEVYLDCIDDAEDGRRYDLDEVAVSAVPWHSGSALSGDTMRHTELLRATLERRMEGRDADNRSVSFMEPNSLGPIGTLYSAVLAMASDSSDIQRVRELVAWLRENWTDHSADVALLDAWCAVREGLSIEAPEGSRLLAFDAVPMIDRCWPLLSQIGKTVILAPSMQFVVALWRTSGGTFVQTQTPDELRGATLRGKSTGPLTSSALDLRRVASLIQRPSRYASPFHQTVRRVLIDMSANSDEVALSNEIDNLARAAGVDPLILVFIISDLLPPQSAEGSSEQYEYAS